MIHSVDEESRTGFYNLYQLCSVRETQRQKGHVGIFPWGKTKIFQLVKEGKFPKPIKNLGRDNLWPKEAVHEFIEKITSVAQETETA